MSTRIRVIVTKTQTQAISIHLFLFKMKNRNISKEKDKIKTQSCPVERESCVSERLCVLRSPYAIEVEGLDDAGILKPPRKTYGSTSDAPSSFPLTPSLLGAGSRTAPETRDLPDFTLDELWPEGAKPVRKDPFPREMASKLLGREPKSSICPCEWVCGEGSDGSTEDTEGNPPPPPPML